MTRRQASILITVVALAGYLVLLVGRVVCIEPMPERIRPLAESAERSEELARYLARLCQTLQTERVFRDFKHFPAGVRDLRPSFASGSPQAIRIELGGGFEHYGIVCSRVAIREEDRIAVWELRSYSEFYGARFLATVALSADARLESIPEAGLSTIPADVD